MNVILLNAFKIIYLNYIIRNSAYILSLRSLHKNNRRKGRYLYLFVSNHLLGNLLLNRTELTKIPKVSLFSKPNKKGDTWLDREKSDFKNEIKRTGQY